MEVKGTPTVNGTSIEEPEVLGDAIVETGDGLEFSYAGTAYCDVTDIPEQVRVIDGLYIDKNVEIWHEKDYKFNAPHHFVLVQPLNDQTGKLVGTVDFQEGPIGEVGVNGVSNEMLITMVIARLRGFQNSEYSSRDNALAITDLENALLRLNKRTYDREARKVEGTSQV